MKSKTVRVGLVVAVSGLGGLAWLVLTFISAPGSRPYRPVSPWEERVRRASSVDVHPDDVRAALEVNRVQVAWAGLLREALYEGGPQPLGRFTIEHHYFDWIEDRGAQRASFLPSPRGEGLFRCTWPLRPEWDLDAMRKLTPPGSFVIVYGTPVRLDGATIDLGQAAYVRLLPPEAASTKVLDYGKPAARDVVPRQGHTP